MEEKKPTCCSNPELGHLDEKSSRSLGRFIAWFLVGFIILVSLMLVFRDAPVVRHLFMSPDQMKEHTINKGGN